jgi:hypothetical protein
VGKNVGFRANTNPYHEHGLERSDERSFERLRITAQAAFSAACRNKKGRQPDSIASHGKIAECR